MARLIKAVTESFSDMESWKEICDTFNEHKARNYSNFLDVRVIMWSYRLWPVYRG